MSPSCMCGRGSDLTLIAETREKIGTGAVETRRKYRCSNGHVGTVLDVDGGETRHFGCLTVGR